jgi:hypothetical protein
MKLWFAKYTEIVGARDIREPREKETTNTVVVIIGMNIDSLW